MNCITGGESHDTLTVSHKEPRFPRHVDTHVHTWTHLDTHTHNTPLDTYKSSISKSDTGDFHGEGTPHNSDSRSCMGDLFQDL